MAHGTSLRSLAKDEKPEKAAPVLRRLAGYLRPHRRLVAVALGWMVLSSATLAAQPGLIGWLIDSALDAADAGGDTRTLVLPVAALTGVAILGWISQRAQILQLGQIGQEALYVLRRDVFSAVQRLSLDFFDSTESGDLMSRLINDIEQINSFLSQGLRRVVSSGLALVATLAGMLVVDWRLALATLAVVPGVLGATRVFGAIARRAFRRRQESIGDVSATLAEELGGIKVAQAFNRTERNREEFATRNAVNRDANITASAISAAFSPTLSVISTASTVLVTVFGGWLAVRGLVTVGVVVAFFNYARQFFNAVSQLSSLYAETQSAFAGGERIFALMDTHPSVSDDPGAIDIAPTRGPLRFESVRFAYATGPDVLHDIDLEIEPGTSVAIVGATGAGKTTLVNLVPRFYDPVEGRVTLGGHDLRDVTLVSLRRGLGIVLQEPFLFTGTIAENIRYGRLDADDAAVEAAARDAGALPFIERLPDRFETDLGERGLTLSTGQRQLLSLARAVLADPDILILDEATSSVDTRTEGLIQSALGRLLSDRTALVIAHRLSTVRTVDRIVVLEHGRIVEDGSYEALLSGRGAFSRLHEAQFAE